MIAVAVGTNRPIFALQHGASMHALQVLLDGMEDRNLMARQKSEVRMALRTSKGLIFLRHLRRRFAGSLDFVR